MKRKKGYYSISVVAKMFSVHQQTIRMYEKEGLISPKRTEGNTRLFSEEDVDRLEEIISLTHNLGVNLAGVQIILKLQKKISKMQEDMNKSFEQMQGQLSQDKDDYQVNLKKYGERLVDLKKEGLAKVPVAKVEQEDKRESEQESEVGNSDWEIDYDEQE